MVCAIGWWKIKNEGRTFNWIHYLPSKWNQSRTRRWICWQPLPWLLQSIFLQTNSSNTGTWWSRRGQMLLVLWTPWLVTIWYQISATFWINLIIDAWFDFKWKFTFCSLSASSSKVPVLVRACHTDKIWELSSSHSQESSVLRKSKLFCQWKDLTFGCKWTYLLHHWTNCWQKM